MAVVIDGTNGISTPDLESAGPVTGTTGTFSGAVQASGVATNLYPLVSGTAVTASSTSVDFTGIPSWVKRVTVLFDGVSTNGTSAIGLRIGPLAGVETSGYTSQGSYVNGTPSSALFGATAQFNLVSGTGMTAGSVHYGTVVLNKISSNIWILSATMYRDAGTAYVFTIVGRKSLADTLSIVQVYAGGTDTFDAGSINIMWE